VIAQYVETTGSDSAASTGLGIGLTLIILVVGLALFVFHIYVLVDILKHGDAAWQASGQNTSLWIGLWVLAFCCGGIIIDLIYWLAIRPKLVAPGAAPGGYPNHPT
jgi:D-alanyl-lipoteichoic acid acyltransferase DltB (MBOAT superfamily)